MSNLQPVPYRQARPAFLEKEERQFAENGECRSARSSFFLLHGDCARQNRDFVRQMKISTIDILRKQR